MTSSANTGRAAALSALAALLLATTAISISHGLRTQHYPFLNDFWPLLFWADRLDWSKAESFRNGFFPPGYPVFLSIIANKQILGVAYYANLCFALGTMTVTFFATRALTTATAAALAASLTGAYPINFSLMMTTGPDTGCVFFLCMAFVLAHIELAANDRRWAWLCGAVGSILLFIAILWRYHALVYSITILVALTLVHRGRVPWRVVPGIVAALVTLAGLSLFPGLSDQLGRAQAFGVWEAMHPVDWYHMPRDLPPSVGAVIREAPEAFWRAYWQFHRPFVWMLAPPILAAVVSGGLARQAALSIGLVTVVYLPIVGMGTSLRGIAPIVPCTMLCVGLVVGAAQRWLSGRFHVLVATAVPVLAVASTLAGAWWNQNRAFMAAAVDGYEWRRAVELELRAQGVTAPLQVFGDAGFHFVTQHGGGWYSYLPRSNGGWPRLDLYDLERIAPEIRTDSLSAFLDDCARSGITHLVLSGTAGGLVPELGLVFNGQLIEPRLRLTATVATLKIFRLGA